MPIDDQKLTEDYEAYITYRDDTREWRESRDKASKFVAGSQHSSNYSSELEARGQTDIIVNRIRPLINTRISMMIANKPIGQIFGTRDDDIGNAAILGEFFDWHWYNSDGQVVLERIVRGQQVHGIAWLGIYSDNVADYGRGELKFCAIPFNNVFVDKAAGAHPLFDDAPVLIHTKLRRPFDFFNSLPKSVRIKNDVSLYVPNDEIVWSGKGAHQEDIQTGVPLSLTNAYPQEKGEYLRELDVYKRSVHEIQILRSVETGKVYKVLDDDEEPNREEKILLKKNVTDADAATLGVDPQLIPKLKLELATAPVWRVEYYKQISGKLYVPNSYDVLPISNYPIVPIVNEDVGNSMPRGETDYLMGIQELINASVGLTLLNAALASNWRVLTDAAKAQINDLKAVQKNFSVPGAWIDMKTDPVTGKFPVEIMHPEPLPQAWFTLIEYFSQALEFQMSTFSLRTGDPSGAPETLGATLQLGQWAQDILRISLNRLELGLERSFNVLLEWMPHYYDFRKTFPILGVDSDKMGQEQAINFAEISSAWASLATPGSIKANYRIRAGSTMPSQTVAELNVLQSMAQLQPALIGEVIRKMPGLRDSEKQRIFQTIDQVSQLQNSNAQKDEVIQVLQQQLQHLQESVIALRREQEINKVRPEIDKFLNNMEVMQQKMTAASKNRNGKTR